MVLKIFKKRQNIVLIQLAGGLGNQMFQYALAKVIANKNNAEIKVDKSFFEANITPYSRHFSLEIFNLEISYAVEQDIHYFFWLSLIDNLKKKLRLSYPRMYKESSYYFDPHLLKLKAPVYLKGYFQSFKYFLDRENLIREIYKFPIYELDKKNQKIKETILSNLSVSVHIRRGDYVKDEKVQNFHGNCDMDYYNRGIEYFSAVNTNFTLIFFSDEIDWVIKEFEHFPHNKIYVSGNTEINSWKDMYLMSLCNHNIIANSSFSWWAAWLNENPEKKIIAPRYWFANEERENKSVDLIPPDWIRI